MNYFVANWKMNMDAQSVKSWVSDFKGNKEDVIIACSAPHFYLVAQAGYNACSQDSSEFDKGAHTGETGAFQIAEFCKYCIVGHSERKESPETVIKKRDTCMRAGIIPIVCFSQPDDAQKFYAPECILAWEDPQNISVEGSYREKDPQEIKTNVHVIKASLPENTHLIYGGSVNKLNISDLAAIEGLDGVLVGNASLDPEHFYEICRFKNSAR